MTESGVGIIALPVVPSWLVIVTPLTHSFVHDAVDYHLTGLILGISVSPEEILHGILTRKYYWDQSRWST